MPHTRAASSRVYGYSRKARTVSESSPQESSKTKQASHPHIAKSAIYGAPGVLALLTLFTTTLFAQQNQDWPIYNGRTTGDHYSPLTQINRTNVKTLKQAWTFDTGDQGIWESSPLIVGRTLFIATPTGSIVALDGATGKQQWRFDPETKSRQPIRGLAYLPEGKILAGIMSYLYELDAKTGKPVETFGKQGRIDLREDLDTDPAKATVALTSPGVVYKDLIILGFRAPETHPAPRGDIRAYDVHTGKLRWTFHTIPHPGEFGYDTWAAGAWEHAGAANAWAGMVVDQPRGIVYIPTGSAVDDFYGGDRIGNNLFANTLLALDAATGKRLWHFQGIHHDIWDRDFPAPPVLLTVQHNGKPVDAVAQTTKQGYVYLFDRVTGTPLFPIEEMKVLPSTVPGEKSSPTQPHSLLPEPLARQTLTADTLTTRSPEAHANALEQFKAMRSEGQFVPLSVDRITAVTPGMDGGAEWGGAAVDPRSGILYVNANDIPYITGLTANKPQSSAGAAIYNSQCAMCHAADRKGSPPAFPSLVGITDRLTPAQITDTVQNGKGRMPGFPNVQGEALQSLTDFLRAGKEDIVSGAAAEKTTERELASTGNVPTPFRFLGYKRFVDQDGYPASAPPWGTLNAIDMNTGKYLWRIPFGAYPELSAKGIPTTGTENYGGPVLTASGLLFIASTIFDRQMHAYDTRTGELLWHTELPFGGLATPATYAINGKQYVVIATGGGKDPTHPLGGTLVTFALP
ncbi:Quinoprotein glucose dehydrogenase [Terriglobus saanensis SP1PR4]|uniref:Quinoprotein glucose dehydrogenase n=1 Tax=Terriglobus saanensis (strain ATCC BAA-1853 / DSM 23119 / SP1PR4) TaxID=401053 RepID=E8V698_TERSS|nr:Quinoprotein glucose dehydrogenase [Terriglobus saanensis SP1PR4]